MRLTDFLVDVGRPVAYYPELARIAGSVNASILLCQFIYWQGKGEDPQGWIYKTQNEILKETGLSRYEQETARQKLRSINFLEENLRGIPRKLYFRLNLNEINQSWQEMQQDSDKTARKSLKNRHKVVFPHTIMRKTNMQECGKTTCNNAEIPHTEDPLLLPLPAACANSTEITTENTTEKSSSLPPPQKTDDIQFEQKEMEEEVEKEEKTPVLPPLPSPFDKLKDFELIEAESICKKKGLNMQDQAIALSILYKDKAINNPSNLLLKTLRGGGVAGTEGIIKAEEREKIKEAERQKKAQKQKAERIEKEKEDREYYAEAENRLNILNDDERKKIEELAKESLPDIVKNMPVLVRSKMCEIVMNSGP